MNGNFGTEYFEMSFEISWTGSVIIERWHF